MIAAVLFDFDGTLFDVSDAICHAFNGALAETGRPPLADKDIRAWIGRPLIEMFALEDPAAAPALVSDRIERYRRIFMPVCVERSHPLPGLAPCLDTLRDRGIRLAIVTNRKTDGADRILRGHGFRDRFDQLVGIEDVTRTKPDPEAVLVALRRLNLGPERAVMVGDTPEDLRAATAARVRGIGVTTGAHDAAALAAAGAHAVLPSLAGLPDVIGPDAGPTEKTLR